MESMSEMHHAMSEIHHMTPNGIIGQALGVAGRLSAQFLIVLTSAPVLDILAALVLLLASAVLLRLLLARRTSNSKAHRSRRADMMMNCMNTDTGALIVGGIRLADAALALTVLLLALLAAIATIAVVRFFFDVARRFSARSSRSMQALS
jgi:hypothetical protein